MLEGALEEEEQFGCTGLMSPETLSYQTFSPRPLASPDQSPGRPRDIHAWPGYPSPELVPCPASHVPQHMMLCPSEVLDESVCIRNLLTAPQGLQNALLPASPLYRSSSEATAVYHNQPIHYKDKAFSQADTEYVGTTPDSSSAGEVHSPLGPSVVETSSVHGSPAVGGTLGDALQSKCN